MLTREQARKQPCIPLVSGFLAGTKALTMGKEELLCTANDCPKWVDIDGDGVVLPFCGNGTNVGQHEHCNVASSCNNCPHRYGRCGG